MPLLPVENSTWDGASKCMCSSTLGGAIFSLPVESSKVSCSSMGYIYNNIQDDSCPFTTLFFFHMLSWSVLLYHCAENVH